MFSKNFERKSRWWLGSDYYAFEATRLAIRAIPLKIVVIAYVCLIKVFSNKKTCPLSFQPSILARPEGNKA